MNIQSINEMLEQGLSQSEIGRRLNVHPSYINKLLKVQQESRVAVMRLSVPPGAQGYHDGLFYKRGLRGLVFFWNGHEWRRSTADPRDITWSFRAIK
jgi:hypothetical protein